jgi:hypothetical protein
MKDHLLKVSLKNMSAREATEAEMGSIETTHFSAPESPSLLFRDGTIVRISKDKDGNLMLRVTDPHSAQ